MARHIALVAVTTWMLVANAYAAQAPAEEKEFPLAIVFALIAVFISLGVVFMGVSQNKKKKD